MSVEKYMEFAKRAHIISKVIEDLIDPRNLSPLASEGSVAEIKNITISELKNRREEIWDEMDEIWYGLTVEECEEARNRVIAWKKELDKNATVG